MSAPGTDAWRRKHWWACDAADLVTVTTVQGIRLAVARGTEEAVHALFDVFHAHGYEVRPRVTGSYNCRRITGGSVLSSHAFGTAIDVNWDTNPYVRGRPMITDMPREMTDRVQEIRTVDGVRIWRWGGDWDGRPETPHSVYDAMHFEIIATPEELAAGIERRAEDVPGVRGLPTLRNGSRGPAVRDLQARLDMAAGERDGIFGPRTERAVRIYQATRGLRVDGVVGPATWTALTHDLPALDRAGGTPPGKTWNT